jgi:WD40 repeat protein
MLCNQLGSLFVSLGIQCLLSSSLQSFDHRHPHGHCHPACRAEAVCCGMALLASVSSSLKVWSFDDQNLNLIAECNFKEKGIELNAVTWNHNQQVVAVAGNCSNIYLVQASTGQILSSLPFKEEDRFMGDVVSLSFSNNSRYLASTNNSNAVVWDLKRRSVRTILEGHRHNLNSLLFTPDGILLTGDLDGNLRAWNVDRNTSTADLFHKSLHTPLNSLQLSPSARQLSTGYNDGSVTLWSMESMVPSGHLTSLHDGPISSLSYSPKNEKLLASSALDGKIHLVDVSMNSSTPAMSIRTPEVIQSISFHESSLYISAGSTNGTLYLYDWRNAKKPLQEIPSLNHQSIRSVMFQKQLSKSSSLSLDQSTSSTTPTRVPPMERTEDQKQEIERRQVAITTSTQDIQREPLHNFEERVDRSPRTSRQREDDTFENTSLTLDSDRDLRNISQTQTQQEVDLEIRSSEGINGDGDRKMRSRPVSSTEFTEALQLLRYDIHEELHSLMREQVRQFALAKVRSLSFSASHIFSRKTWREWSRGYLSS